MGAGPATPDPSGHSAAPPPRPAFPANAPEVARRSPRAGVPAMLALAAFVFAGPRLFHWAGVRLCPYRCGCDAFYDSPWWLRLNLGRAGVQAAAAVVVAILGLRAVRGRRAPLSLAALLALAPLGAGLLEANRVEREMAGLLAGTLPTPPFLPDDLGFAVNHLAHGFLDLADAFQVAVSSAGVAMLGVAGLALFALRSLDTSGVGPAPSWSVFRGARSDSLSTTRAPEARLRRATLAAGLLATSAWVLGHALAGAPFAWLDALSLALVLAAAPIAVLASAPLPALVAHRNDGEAGGAFRTLALCAFAFAAAALLLDAQRVGLELRDPVALGALYSCGHEAIAAAPPEGPWVTPPAIARPALLVGLAALASLAPFVPGLVAGARAKKGKASAGGLAVAALAVLVVVAGGALWTRVAGDVAEVRVPYERSELAMRRAGLVLPVSHGATTARAYPARWIVSPSGVADACAGLGASCGRLAERRTWERTYGQPEPFPDDIATSGEMPFDSVVAPEAGTTVDELYAVLDAIGWWSAADVVVTADRAPFEEAVARAPWAVPHRR